jgi:Transposase DDE domain
MAIADRAGLPLAITIASASPHETQLVAQTLNASFLPDNPVRLIGDAAYDSDGLDRQLADCGIELIAPHRGNRINITQDGRSAATNGGGAWNACLPGSRILGAWSPVMNAAPPTLPASSTWRAR